jgi:hypothetical protein
MKLGGVSLAQRGEPTLHLQTLHPASPHATA